MFDLNLKNTLFKGCFSPQICQVFIVWSGKVPFLAGFKIIARCMFFVFSLCKNDKKSTFLIFQKSGRSPDKANKIQDFGSPQNSFLKISKTTTFTHHSNK
eukprot:TRINITY_DN1585_c0_g1_i1.p1 TRINITY_DN1585_c0_g1~~TRINITY_DN1585_c0_g1_i1.p1  ORF type:complete len:100 (-),score=13.41 TRINITY_DN1585_c0_g1_i1:507-806(-)